MIMDAELVAFENQGFTSNISEGVVELKAVIPAVYPTGNLRKRMPIGEGTALLVHAVISPGGTGTGTANSGSCTVTISIDDLADPTTVVAYGKFDVGQFTENGGVHVYLAIPSTAVGKNCKISVDDTSVVGLGTAPTATAWIFAA